MEGWCSRRQDRPHVASGDSEFESRGGIFVTKKRVLAKRVETPLKNCFFTVKKVDTCQKNIQKGVTRNHNHCHIDVCLAACEGVDDTCMHGSSCKRIHI